MDSRTVVKKLQNENESGQSKFRVFLFHVLFPNKFPLTLLFTFVLTFTSLEDFE